MKKLNTDLLTSICEVAGAPGFEQRVRNLVINEIKDIVDEYQIDNLGNVIAIKKGQSSDKKVMIGAHMDEIGLLLLILMTRGLYVFIH